MLKPQRNKRKSKQSIIKLYNKGNDNFKNTSYQVNTSDLVTIAKGKLTKISDIPKKNEQIRIVTKKAINTFDFILAILDEEIINNLTIAIYRIGKKTASQLKELQDTNKINKITILINDGFPKLIPDCWNLLKTYESKKFILKLENNHTKIILAETNKNNYVIEGSGNLSINARIEQYMFENNKNVFNFHKNWINKI